jgi:hypothetical protein
LFEMPNPYLYDEEPSNYAPFDLPGQTDCTISTGPSGACEIVDNLNFKITLDSDATDKKIIGTTTAKPFQNPYSSRRIDTFTVTIYTACDLASEPAVQGDTQRTTTFVPGEILASAIQLESSSTVIGVTDATLTLTFTPPSMMPAKGKVALTVPHWYQSASVKQNTPFDQFVGSVLDFDSTATLKSGQPLTTTQGFDQNAQILTLNYETSAEWNSKLVIEFTNFKNPISQSQMVGFQVVTTDSMSYIVDKSNDQVELSTIVTETQTF